MILSILFKISPFFLLFYLSLCQNMPIRLFFIYSLFSGRILHSAARFVKHQVLLFHLCASSFTKHSCEYIYDDTAVHKVWGFVTVQNHKQLCYFTVTLHWYLSSPTFTIITAFPFCTPHTTPF